MPWRAIRGIDAPHSDPAIIFFQTFLNVRPLVSSSITSIAASAQVPSTAGPVYSPNASTLIALSQSGWRWQHCDRPLSRLTKLDAIALLERFAHQNYPVLERFDSRSVVSLNTYVHRHWCSYIVSVKDGVWIVSMLRSQGGSISSNTPQCR